MEITVVRLGLVNYNESLQIQQSLVVQRQQQQIGDTLLLLEHPPVLTLGKRGIAANIIVPKQYLEAHQVDVYEVERGGDVTYHGPGQLVGYPIMDLTQHGKDIKDFIWRIEEIFIRLLGQEYQITAVRDEKKYTGVWVDDTKITAIGVAVDHWVTSHGFAFNVNTNLEHFKWINPCGITDKGVTSLQRITGQSQDFEYLNQLVVKYFGDVFNVEPQFISKSDFLLHK